MIKDYSVFVVLNESMAFCGRGLVFLIRKSFANKEFVRVYSA